MLLRELYVKMGSIYLVFIGDLILFECRCAGLTGPLKSGGHTELKELGTCSRDEATCP